MGELSVMLTLSLLYGNILDPKTGKDQSKHHWSYVGDDGPDHWRGHYPKCGGHRQSPVDIRTGEVEYASWLTDLQFESYDKYLGQGFSKPITVKNNGHTASMAVTDNLTLRGAHLNGDYKLAEMHMHWGSNNNIGAEHAVNGKKNPAEIHFVHFAHKYGNLSEAMKMPDGLAVIGVFVELVPEINYAVDHLINGLESIMNYGSKTNLSQIRMMDFLPMNTNKFYHYRGSLTTPPCYESVLWFVMADPIRMSGRQLDRFRYLQEKIHEHVAATGTAHSHSRRVFKSEPIYIRDNFRPLQPLNGRKIYSNLVTLDRPRLSHFELPSIKRTPIQRQVLPSMRSLPAVVQGMPAAQGMHRNGITNNQVQHNTQRTNDRPGTDYIYRGLSPNTFNQAPRYGSSINGVISNRNNLLIGSISSNDVKGAIRQHLLPDYKHASRPSNTLNTHQGNGAVSSMPNDLNGRKARPLLDYIFTQMDGLTRNAPNQRRYNVHDHPGMSQPKDRIFGGLSDLLTNPSNSRVLSNPFVNNEFVQSSTNQGNTKINNIKSRSQTNKHLQKNNNLTMKIKSHTKQKLHTNNHIGNSNTNPSSSTYISSNTHGNVQGNSQVHGSQHFNQPQHFTVPTTMFPIMDYNQPRYVT